MVSDVRRLYRIHQAPPDHIDLLQHPSRHPPHEFFGMEITATDYPILDTFVGEGLSREWLQTTG